MWFHSTKTISPSLVKVVLLQLVFCFAVNRAETSETISYYLIGVSGGLQDGFPDHVKMDYHYTSNSNDNPADRDGNKESSSASSTSSSTVIPAIFLGQALVRGCRSYLDVMQQGWRQYAPEPEQPLINSVNIVSGCYEHANQYWVYAVDSRQVLSVLCNEPRFLSITPDTALVDLTAEQTDPLIKHIAWNEIRKQGKSDETVVALPIVVATWFQSESFVPSPPIMQLPDGTNVTTFAESLALWANVNDADRTAGTTITGASGACLHNTTGEHDTNNNNSNNNNGSCVNTDEAAIQEAHARYWDGIRRAVRAAEQDRQALQDSSAWAAPPFSCQKRAPMGVTTDQARINYPFTKHALQEMITSLLDGSTYDINFETAMIVQKK